VNSVVIINHEFHTLRGLTPNSPFHCCWH